MPGRLQDRIALVTGASSGLGRAISLHLASEGAKICCVDLYETPRNERNATTGKADDFHHRVPGESTVDQIHRLYGDGLATFVRANVTVATEVQAAVSHCVTTFSRLDILCANAGISVESTHPSPLPLHLLPEEDWDMTMSINTKGVFLSCKYALQQMLLQPRFPLSSSTKIRAWIVLTSSVQGLVAYTHTPAYTASKSAVSGLARQIALDYAQHDIVCNAVCPGFLRTDMTRNLQEDERLRAEIDARHPLGGMGRVEDVARMVGVLASEDVAWVTGVNLAVDGGYTAM